MNSTNEDMIPPFEIDPDNAVLEYDMSTGVARSATGAETIESLRVMPAAAQQLPGRYLVSKVTTVQASHPPMDYV